MIFYWLLALVRFQRIVAVWSYIGGSDWCRRWCFKPQDLLHEKCSKQVNNVRKSLITSSAIASRTLHQFHLATPAGGLAWPRQVTADLRFSVRCVSTSKTVQVILVFCTHSWYWCACLDIGCLQPRPASFCQLGYNLAWRWFKTWNPSWQYMCIIEIRLLIAQGVYHSRILEIPWIWSTSWNSLKTPGI